MKINKDIIYIKPETYRLISIQNKEVLDIIESQGVYRPLINLVRCEELKILYEDMIRLMYKSIPIEKPYAPVWGFYRLNSELPPEDIHSKVYYGKCPSPLTEDKDLVMLVLDVPCTEVLLTSFCEWTDYIYFKKYPNEDPYTCSVEDILKHSRNYEDSYEVQATFPKITKDMIVRVIYPDKKI
jgi:hypothetical protein